MGSKKTKTTEHAVTKPQVPDYAMPAIQNYFGQTNEFLNGGADWFAPVNPLQEQAFGMASDIAGMGIQNPERPEVVKPRSMTLVSKMDPLRATKADVGNLGPQAMALNPDAPELAHLGNADDYAVDAAQIAQTAGASGGRASQFMNDYMDPFIEDVVEAALADYDYDAGRREAEYQAQGALNKAFGGSGYRIGEAELGANLTRGRAATDANLRSEAFRTALEAGAGDANRGTQASVANAQMEAARAQQQAMLDQQAAMRNSELGSQFDLARFLGQNDINAMVYGTTAQNNQLNANTANQFSLADFGATNTANLANAQAANAMRSQAFDTEADRKFNNANTANQFSLTNAQAGNAMEALRYGTEADLEVARANDQINRLGGLLTAGNTLYGIQNQQSPIGRLQLAGGLLNPGGTLNTVTGQEMNGTSTTKQSGGLMGGLLGAGTLFGSIFEPIKIK